MVFYFTATGNSLYVAKQFDDNPISIVKTQKNATYKDENIGIICPTYCGEIPKIVFNFIKNSKFNTPYLYLILTYGMSESDCPEFTYDQCKKVSVTFDYISFVKMVDNYLPAFDMAKEKKIDKDIPSQIERIRREIESRKKDIPVANDEGRKLHKQVTLMNKLFPAANNGSFLKITDKCNGCGICAKVCPLDNFEITNGKAKRIKKKCEFCLACIHHCPNKAISLKPDKNPNERYINKYISLDEIIKSNCQEE